MEIYLQTQESVTSVALNEPIRPPDAVQRTFLEGLGEVNQRNEQQFCLRIYALSVEELANDAVDLSPEAVGWYFVGTDSTGDIVAGEVPVTSGVPDSSQPLTASLSFGSAVCEALKAYDQVKTHPELQAQPYQPRWLRIPGLRIEAFWLKAAPFDDHLGDDDRLYACRAFQPELKSRLVSGREFREIAQKLAAASLPIDNAPPLDLAR
jgi:hypothetical protein